MIGGQSSTYLQETGQFEWESELLRSFSLKYLTKLSYEQTSELVQTVTNVKISRSRLGSMLEEEVSKIELEQSLLIDNQLDIEGVIATTPIEIYDESSEEILFMKDGVCVKKQKAIRDKISKEKRERTFTNVMSLELPNHTFETIITAPIINENIYCKARIKYHYKSSHQPLPIVVISDGATSIKNDAKAMFGENITHILDWYHLDKKVGQYLSSISPNKIVKEQDYKTIIGHLWEGNDPKAINYLEQVESRNHEKKQDLIKYLKKNQSHLICYKYRQGIGKTIGSGRVEKANDLMVANRQKKNGMSWSPQGSTNLAILSAFLYNQKNTSTK